MTPQPHPGQSGDRYEAMAYCGNCAYEGPVSPLVGQHLSKELCPVCGTRNLLSVAMREWERERGRP